MLNTRILPAALAALVLTAGFAGGTAAQGPTEGPLYPPDTFLTRTPTPQGIARPAYRQPVLDPSFGTTVTRISDERAFDQEGFGVIRHAYAKNQPWNADESLLMLDVRYPAPLLDGQTFELIGRVHQPSEAIWLNTDPQHMVGVAGNKLVQWDALADRRSAVLHRFRGHRRIALGLGEGNLSNDDRYAALLGQKGGNRVDVLVLDLVEGRIVGRRSYPRTGLGENDRSVFNNVAMSQSGDRVIVEFNRQGEGPRSGIVSFDRRLRDRVHLSKLGGTHFDTCVGPSGAETIVAGADDGSTIVSIDLTDGIKTALLPEDSIAYPIHISCRNVARPGWAYISEYFDPRAPRRLNHDEVFAVRLDGSGVVERFAHQHISTSRDYEHEPHAVPSRDGSRVLWASDWENRKGPVYAYVAEQR